MAKAPRASTITTRDGKRRRLVELFLWRESLPRPSRLTPCSECKAPGYTRGRKTWCYNCRIGALHPHGPHDIPAVRTCLHCEICGDLPASNAILGLAFACDTCCSETRQATPPLAPRSHCQDCHDTDNAGQWTFGLDGRRLCNTHFTQEPTPSEYIRARAQLILSKAGAMDPAIGRRFAAPN